MIENSSHIAYAMELPGTVVGNYSAMPSLLAVELDNQENIYTTSARTVYETDFAGVTQTTLINMAEFGGPTVTEYTYITAMSFGPGAYGRNLFIADGLNHISRICVLDTIWNANRPVKLPVPGVVSQLDFDEKGNIYTAGNGNLYFADSSVGMGTAPTFTAISGYPPIANMNLIKIRVVKESGNQYLYVADPTHVWKSQVMGVGSSFNGTLLVDLSTHPELSGCTISSFEIDENSSIFLCLKNSPKYSLFICENNGSVTPFYSDPRILPNTVDKLMWGNSKYLYLISSSLSGAGKIYRMTLDRNGAPYQGRTFIK